MLKTKKLELEDQTAKIFLNRKGEKESLDADIAPFLRYVDGKTAGDTFSKEINQEVIRMKKHDETRREYMTYERELKQWKRQCFAEGEKRQRKKPLSTWLKFICLKKQLQKSPKAH